MQKNKRQKSFLCLGVLIIFIFIFFLAYVKIKKDNHIDIRLLYEYYTCESSDVIMHIASSDRQYDIEPHMPYEDTKSGGWIDAIYNLDGINEMKNISIDLLEQEPGRSCLVSLEIYRNGLQVAKYTPEDLLLLFNDNAEKKVINSIGINYYLDDKNGITITAKEIFLEELNKAKKCDKYAVINLLFLFGFLMIIVCLCTLKEKTHLKSIKPEGWFEVALLIMLVILFFITAFIALGSTHHSHCDEEVSRHAIDYYLRAWQKPTKKSHWLAGTSSYKYGNHYRVLENTFYYILAGKIGWIAREFFGISRYYRIFGIILFGILLGFIWYERRDSKVLCLSVLLTPQVSYIFSYATSDSLDYFWGVIVLMLTIKQNGILNRWINGDLSKKKKISDYFLICAIFLMLFLGKSNYLVVLWVPFTHLLVLWLKNGMKKQTVFKYISVWAGILAMWICFSAMPVDSGKNTELIPTETIMENNVQNSNIVYDNTLWQKKESQVAPQKKGVDFKTFLFDYTYQPTPIVLWSTAFGAFYWSSVTVPTKYIYLVTLLLVIFGLYCMERIYRKNDTYLKISTLMSIIGMSICFLVAMLYCYYVTYQPQGRYILPIFLIFIYMASLVNEIYEKNGIKLTLCLFGLLNICNYAYAAVFLAEQNNMFVF